jgi:monoamine oxidase
MNRRDFLRGATAASFFSSTLVAQSISRPKVIVVGGGLAGLCTAYELRKAGYQVTVLEGQGRAGGRVLTLREGLFPGLTAETGATRIPDRHHITLSYVQEFGLTLEPFHQGDLDDVIHFRGKNYLETQGNEPDWPLQLTAEERRLGRKGLAERYLGGPLKLALSRRG